MRKTGLSLEQHARIGLRLSAIRDELVTLGVEIANAYPKADKLNRLSHADEHVDKLRSALDDKLAIEFPDDWKSSTYYPHR